jgi:hypothetical protein
LNVYTATANGAFQQKQSNKLLGVAPKAAATGDFDGDGKLDLVIVDVIAAQVSVLTGAGDGTFGAPAGGFAVPVYTGYVIASADWNGDGKPDVATSGPELALALGKGGGAFGTVALYSDGSSYGCLFTSDINSDGKPDLIAGGGPSFTLLLGAGDGTFPISVSYIGGIGSSGIAVDDFNGDGKRDVAVADSQVVNVLINQTP